MFSFAFFYKLQISMKISPHFVFETCVSLIYEGWYEFKERQGHPYHSCMNITNIHHCLIKGKIIDIPFKQSCTKSLHYVCTMYMLTTTSYFATTSTLNYCILICAWVGGLIFGNKTIYIYIPKNVHRRLLLSFQWPYVLYWICLLFSPVMLPFLLR